MTILFFVGKPIASKFFVSVGVAMAYADEHVDCDVVVLGGDDKVYRRESGRWRK